MWAMVNTLLLSEARSRGFGIYRNVMRRVGLGFQGGRVLTKRELRSILEQEDRMRVLVSQLSTVGRDVRSTMMQWEYEGKKLGSTVKHMSWVPPWVEQRDRSGGAEESPGARFMDKDAGDERVPDYVGLGRHPGLWWTLNCKYNAAYDVQRLNTESTSGRAGLRTRGEGDKEERFAFTRENPDLVAYEMALRAELHMRMVMPTIVPHSEDWPYMTMARFETGPGGNPHYHGFSMGTPGPVVKRVKADVAGADDLPPRTMSEDVRVVRGAMQTERGPMEWQYGDAWSRSKVLEKVEEVLVAEDDAQRIEGDKVPVGAQDANIVPGHEFARGRVSAVIEYLVETGVLSELPGEGEGEVSDVRYVLVPPAPPVPEVERGSKRRGWRWGDRQANMAGDVVDLGILKPVEEDQQLQSSLEDQFAEFFEGIVSEWNPCFTGDGRWRYKWDTEIGAHAVDVELDPLDEAGLEGPEEAKFREREAKRSSEEKAVREVNAREPDRVNLRGLLDKVYASGGEKEVDVQCVRRLVAALVNRVARHTKHGHHAPTLGLHACARGKEGCAVCRYGFPRERLPRDPSGKRRMCMERGALEGQWHAKFPRNDRLCCSYEAHVLLANMGNVDWRPVLNLWAVVQYVTKYATKAPKGSRRLHEVLKDAVDEVCQYVPENEGSDLLRRSIQKFFCEISRRA
jgi:hypothetical protein